MGLLVRHALAVLALAGAAGCGLIARSDEPGLRGMTGELRVTPATEVGTLAFTDACGGRQRVALGPSLRAALAKEMERAFGGPPVSPDRPGAARPDRVIAVDLIEHDIILFVSGKTARTYPATVALAVEVATLDASETLLDVRRFQGEVSGTVRTDGQQCGIAGVNRLAVEAAETLAEDVGEYLRHSPVVALGLGSQTGESPATVTLSFRARLTDENGDHVLDGDESLTLELEVTNTGQRRARGVQVVLSGSAEVVHALPQRIAFGDLGPGATERRAIEWRLGPVSEGGERELIVSLEARSPGTQLPARKKFLVTLRPKQIAAVMVVPLRQHPKTH